MASAGYGFIHLDKGGMQEGVALNGPVTVTGSFSNNVLTVSTLSNRTVTQGSKLTAVYTGSTNGYPGTPSSLSDGSCYTITDYIIALISNVNSLNGDIAFDIEFLAGSSAVPGEYDVTCSCQYDGCFLDVGPVYVQPAPVTTISMAGTIIASSAEQITCTTCSVVVGQQIVLSGYPATGGTWMISGPTYASWSGTGPPPNPTAPASGGVSFYWVPDGNNDATNDYTVTYTVGGITASATFTVAAPTVSQVQGGTHANTGLAAGYLTSQANLTAIVTPPPGFVGAASWIQAIPSAVYLFTNQSGSTLAACGPEPPGPPWLDGGNPYPILYPGPLQPNQYGYYDSPNVLLAAAQQDGAAGVTRQVNFVVYLMWQPQIEGTTTFEVALMAAPWGFSDWANLVNNTWTSGGTITQQLAPDWMTSYPVWSGTAQLRAEPVCTTIIGQ